MLVASAGIDESLWTPSKCAGAESRRNCLVDTSLVETKTKNQTQNQTIALSSRIQPDPMPQQQQPQTQPNDLQQLLKQQEELSARIRRQLSGGGGGGGGHAPVATAAPVAAIQQPVETVDSLSAINNKWI